MQLDAAIYCESSRLEQQSRLQFDLPIEQIEMANVLVREFVILIASWSLLSGCAETKQAGESDSNPALQQGDHEVHGEMGVMYGHTMR